MAADIILTTALIVILRKCKTGLRRYVANFDLALFVPSYCLLSTDSMIDVLVVYTINTGMSPDIAQGLLPSHPRMFRALDWVSI